MAIRFTRTTNDVFKIEPNEHLGDLPPEGVDEESVTIRVIKTPEGARMLIRFAEGHDRFTEHIVTGLAGAPPIKDLVEEVADVVKTMITGLLKPPGQDRYVEIAPGEWVAKADRKPPDNPESVKAEVFASLEKLVQLDKKLTRPNAVMFGGLSVSSTRSLDRKLRNVRLKWTDLVHEFRARSTTKIHI